MMTTDLQPPDHGHVFPKIRRNLTIMVVLRQDALECGACLAPLLVPAVVAGAVEGPVLGIGAEGLLRARVGDDGVLDAEPGQAEASLALRQVEPRGKRGGMITF